MNRNLRLGTLCTALLLAAAAMYVEPRPAHAICVCDTEGGTYVTDCWGKGSSCEAAVTNLPTACRSIANQACNSMGYDGGSCQQTVYQNSPYYCWFDAGSGMWVVDGVVTFKCRTCDLPECRVITIYIPDEAPWTCYCNDGKPCNPPSDGTPHCEDKYAPYCWATAPPTTSAE